MLKLNLVFAVVIDVVVVVVADVLRKQNFNMCITYYIDMLKLNQLIHFVVTAVMIFVAGVVVVAVAGVLRIQNYNRLFIKSKC